MAVRSEARRRPEGRLVVQLIAECQYAPATLQEFKQRFWEGRVQAVTQLTERAIHEGDLRPDVQPREIAEMLYSPIYLRLLFQTGSLDAESIEGHMDVALEELGARTAQR